MALTGIEREFGVSIDRLREKTQHFDLNPTDFCNGILRLIAVENEPIEIGKPRHARAQRRERQIAVPKCEVAVAATLMADTQCDVS